MTRHRCEQVGGGRPSICPPLLDSSPPRRVGPIRPRLLAAAVLVAWQLAAAAAGSGGTSPPALSGSWAVRIVQPATGCDWLGEVRLNEKAGLLTGEGSAAATKDSRDPRRCPPLKGEIDGSVRGEVVRFGFATGRLGKAEFEGRIVKQGREMQGSWTTRSAAGQWAAAR